MQHPIDRTVKYFLYARKSQESEDRQVQSLDDQIQVMTDLAKRAGLPIVEVLTEAKSAKMPNQRSVFSSMLKRIEKGEAQGILCWQINRLSRNPIESGMISWFLQQGVIRCIQTIDRRYVPDDNVLLFNVESGMANQFIIDLRKNCKRGTIGKAQRGWLPTYAPTGYLNEHTGERGIIPDPERFHIIRKMWDLMLTGAYTVEEVRKIACGSWGLIMRKHKKSSDRLPSLSAVYGWFNNLFYAGKFEWDGKLYEGKHKAMVTMNEFNQVQRILGKEAHSSAFVHDFAYTGFIKCSKCGSQYTASDKVKFVKGINAFRTYTYYHCTRKKKSSVCNPTVQKPISLPRLENSLITELAEFSMPEEAIRWCMKALEIERPSMTAVNQKTVESTEKALEVGEKELENLNRMYYRELIGEGFYEKEKKILSRKIESLKESMEKQSDPQAELEKAITAFFVAIRAASVLKEGTSKEKKALLLQVGSNYRMEGEKLLFDKADWLIPIKKSRENLIELYRRLEPKKNLSASDQSADMRLFITKLCTLLDEVRTKYPKGDGCY